MSDTLRRRGCAAALVAAPGLTLAGSLIQASPSAHDTASELASLAAHPGRAELAAGVGFVALVLMIPALLGLARPLWTTRPRFAVTGVCLGVTGTMGLVALMGSAPVSLAMVARDADRAQMIALTDRYESSVLVGLWAMLMIIGFTFGPIVLGIGLWRSGWPALIPAALLAGLVLMVADAGRWPLAAGYACTWLGCGVAGIRLWRTGTDDSEDDRERVAGTHAVNASR